MTGLLQKVGYHSDIDFPIFCKSLSEFHHCPVLFQLRILSLQMQTRNPFSIRFTSDTFIGLDVNHEKKKKNHFRSMLAVHSHVHKVLSTQN